MAAPLDKSPLILSDEFKDILSELEDSREHYFITGRAGTVKSTLLSIFRNTSRKRIAVLAPTGSAALNVRGQTIHSFFGFPPRMINKADISPRRNRRLYQNVDTIIIDEISMVSADLMDAIDRSLRQARGKKHGGIRIKGVSLGPAGALFAGLRGTFGAADFQFFSSLLLLARGIA